VKELQDQVAKDLEVILSKEHGVLAAYLFGSSARGNRTAKSDIDIAVLLSDVPQKMLEYYLYLVKELSQVLGNEVDLVILNTAPPLLKHQILKHGKLVYFRVWVKKAPMLCMGDEFTHHQSYERSSRT